MPSEHAQNIINQLVTEYDASVKRLQTALAHYLKDRTPPSADQRASNDFCYPELVITYAGKQRETQSNLAFGKLEKVGTFRTTFTKPDLFADYIGEQLDLLMEQYELEISVGRSKQEIPFPYVLDGSADLELGTVSPNELARHFPTTELADIGDEIADGLLRIKGNASAPLALFDGLRTDFSLARLRHYTGAPAEDVQHYILFTNYHRYVDEFVSWACTQVGNGRYTALSGAGGLYVDNAVGGAGATGIGENVMRYCGSFLVVEFMRQGMSPTEACLATLHRIASMDPKGYDLSINFIALDKRGRFGAAGTGQGFQYSVACDDYSKVLQSPGVTQKPVGPLGGNRL